MAEYIDRDAFLEQQRAWYCKDCGRRKNTKGKFVYEIGEAPCRACDIGTMLDAVEDYPAADMVERKTGKWIEIRMGSINPLTGRAGVYVGCSECHASIPSDSQLDFIDESDCKFCYNCGAKMEVLIDV